MQPLLNGVFVMSQRFFVLFALGLKLKSMKQDMRSMVSLKGKKSMVKKAGIVEMYVAQYLKTLLWVTKELV